MQSTRYQPAFRPSPGPVRAGHGRRALRSGRTYRAARSLFETSPPFFWNHRPGDVAEHASIPSEDIRPEADAEGTVPLQVAPLENDDPLAGLLNLVEDR